MEAEGSLPHSQESAPCSYLRQIDPVHDLIPILENPLNFIPPSMPRSFLQFPLPKICRQLSYLP